MSIRACYMINRLLLLGSVAALASCAYAIDSHIQDVKIVTPGAHGSVCYAYVDGLRYRAHPPSTINITNSREDLIVDCLAPGNRRKKVVIEARINDNTFLNAGNAGVGVPWDALSGAAYKYPDIVEIDFTNAEVQPEPPPAQNAPDIKQPEEYMLEEFLPAQPVLNSDRTRAPVEIRRRGGDIAVQDDSYVDQTFSMDDGSSGTYSKSNLPDVSAYDLNPAIEPSQQVEPSNTGPAIDPFPLGASQSTSEPSVAPSYGPPTPLLNQ